MRENMKEPSIKRIVVRLTAENVMEFDIDIDIFDDPYMEAATRAVEKSKTLRGALVRPTTKCWDKKTPKKFELYNSYWLLVNAGCYDKAEQLRDKFKIQSDIDLAKEPIHGRDDGTNT